MRFKEENYQVFQLKYIKKLLDCHGMLKAKTTKVLMQETALFLSDALISDLEKAKSLAKVGSIIYAMVETQINIAFTTFIVSQFTKNLSLEHFNAINQILHYLARSCGRGITF